MTREDALRTVNRHAPCPHTNADTHLGDGTVWAKCEDCGATFQQKNWDDIRREDEEFEKAVAVLSDPNSDALRSYAKELKVGSLSVDELVAMHRRLVNELNATSRKDYGRMMEKARKAAVAHYKGRGWVKLDRLRRMSLQKIMELLQR